jgi:hypothetical protein
MPTTSQSSAGQLSSLPTPVGPPPPIAPPTGPPSSIPLQEGETKRQPSQLVPVPTLQIPASSSPTTDQSSRRRICAVCLMSAQNLSQLTNHFRHVHRGPDRPWLTQVQCDVQGCTKLLSRPPKFKDHLWRAHSLWRCYLCGIDFGSDEQLDSHQETCNGV